MQYEQCGDGEVSRTVIAVGPRLSGLLGVLLLALSAGGCVALPAPLASPGATAITARAEGEPVELNSAPVGRLAARRVPAAPRLDSRMDATWAAAQPARIPLTWGLDGDISDGAVDVELRAVYTADTICFLARWRGGAPIGAADTTFNQLTIHWTIPVPDGASQPACAVACHTAYVDGQGRVAYMNSETIPQGGQDALSAAGGWAQGEWSVAWCRPLVSSNAYDLQFADLTVPYLFFVKIFERVDGRPDPVSAPYALVFSADK